MNVYYFYNTKNIQNNAKKLKNHSNEYPDMTEHTIILKSSITT